MRITVVCGSTGKRSANRAALDVAVAHLSGHGVDLVDAPPVDSIPVFRPEQVDDPPAPVAEFRTSTEHCDAVLLAAPEYAGGLAGGMKNALDWLVGSGSLHHRLVGVLSAGTTGGEHALDQLVRTLSWHGALVVAELGIGAPRTKSDVTGRIVDPETVSDIDRWASTVVRAHRGSAAQRLELVSGIVASRGIDPARFGDLA
ncbi:MAG: NAD(P)H-dependent oxidoreductase [Acidimicrobiales bacterium]|nr:NAD(P)H-dependent oxidoreductase [Acidimicrobiales bacterium]